MDDQTSLNLLTQPVGSLVRRASVVASPHDTIHQVAQLMRQEKVSSVMLLEGDRIAGIVTDRDLRNRVLANALPVDRPVHEVATAQPMTIDAQAPVFQGLLMVSRSRIHHLPVVQDGKLLGVITATSLTEQYNVSPVFIAGQIHDQTSLEGLKKQTARVPQLLVSMSKSHASAYGIGHIITGITDAVTIRLLEMAEAELGPPPVPYLWVAAGSQARQEQTAKSDQDNCMILSDDYNPDEHGAYFKALAEKVCAGLDACGYVYCPGDMMAQTDKWRQPLSKWKQYFRKWIGEPEPMALMLSCVFFDLRGIHGQQAMLDELKAYMLDLSKGNAIFLAHMVKNALSHRPPLGWMGGIKVTRGGDNPKTVDLKHNGIVPIVDMARVYALSTSLPVANTRDRLDHVTEGQQISVEAARDLRDALDFISDIRVRHQAQQIESKQKPDNFLRLNELSNFDRAHLQSAYHIVKSLQETLANRYQADRI